MIVWIITGAVIIIAAVALWPRSTASAAVPGTVDAMVGRQQQAGEAAGQMTFEEPSPFDPLGAFATW